MRGLAHNHKLTLLSFQEQGQQIDRKSIGPLLTLSDVARFVPIQERSLMTRLRRLIVNRTPDMSHRLQSATYDVALRELLSGNGASLSSPKGLYEIVQIEGIELARTIPIVRQLAPTAKIVFDNHNAEAELQRRTAQVDLANPVRWPAAAYSLIQGERLRHFESWACRAADWVVAVSEVDRSHLLRLAPQSPITVIPNCVDVRDYEIGNQETGKSFDLVFSGKMDYRPNVDAALWFVKKVWPIIRQRRPTTTMAIVGQKPHSRLAKIREREGITVTGFVENVAPYIAGAKVCVMPFRVGSGTRLKLIEALASGAAIVSTTVGVEGFSVKNERELLVADDPEPFAAGVLRLLADPELRAEFAARGRCFAQTYDFRNVVPRFERVYQQLTGLNG